MNKKDFIFRRLKFHDIKEILDLENLIFPSPWTEDMIEHEATSSYSNFYVLQNSKSRIIAYFGLWILTDEGHINNFAVHPDFRGQKLGSLLLEKIFELGRSAGVSFYYLEVRVSNEPAINLYKKYGFFEAGIRRKYYRNPVEDALLMTKFA